MNLSRVAPEDTRVPQHLDNTYRRCTPSVAHPCLETSSASDPSHGHSLGGAGGPSRNKSCGELEYHLAYKSCGELEYHLALCSNGVVRQEERTPQKIKELQLEPLRKHKESVACVCACWIS